MKQFGRSLLNPTLAAARRNFSVGALLGSPPKSAQQGFKDDAAERDSAMRLAFRDAKARSDNRPAREAPAKARRRDGHA